MIFLNADCLCGHDCRSTGTIGPCLLSEAGDVTLLVSTAMRVKVLSEPPKDGRGEVIRDPGYSIGGAIVHSPTHDAVPGEGMADAAGAGYHEDGYMMPTQELSRQRGD